jgi:KaiC/GvpD/RAD55 family RecA-like ATPase
VQEVKTSVNKRVEYILQTFRSHSIGKDCYTVDRSLSRKESKYELRVEISVQFRNFTKCQEVSNLLVEKLDASVQVSRPSFHYMPGRLESLRSVCILQYSAPIARSVEADFFIQ